MNNDYAMLSGVGDKNVNEDSVRACRNEGLEMSCFALADGLGAHGHGEVAAGLATGAVNAFVSTVLTEEPNLLESCFEGAQMLLRREMERMNLPMIRTTLVVLILRGQTAQWGHIGDSRLYLFRKGSVIARTRDHSVPQMLFEQGMITEREIAHHPQRNRLRRAMGEEWDEPCFDVDERQFPVEPGDSFLLCSDGFWEWFDEKKVGRILQKRLSAKDALHRINREVERNGAKAKMDNYSAILIKL